MPPDIIRIGQFYRRCKVASGYQLLEQMTIAETREARTRRKPFEVVLRRLDPRIPVFVSGARGRGCPRMISVG